MSRRNEAGGIASGPVKPHCRFLIVFDDEAIEADVGPETQCVIADAYAIVNATERVYAPSFDENYSSRVFRHLACAPLFGSALIAREMFRGAE